MAELATCLTTIVALLVIFAFLSINKIKEAKIEINKKLCDEKIRYAREKSKIWLEAEKKKKELGITSSPPLK